MVTSVNGTSLAALLAQEQALANRPGAADGSAVAGAAAGDAAADPAVILSGTTGAPDLSAVLALTDSLNRAASISDVGISAGQTIAGLLSSLKDTAQAAQTAAPQDLQSLEAEFQSGLATIDQLANSASFQGVKMLDGQSSQDLSFQADLTGSSTVNLTPQDFTVGGPVLGLAGATLTGDLTQVLDQLDQASGAVDDQLGQMSVQAGQIQAHLGVIGQLQTTLSAGGETQPDADSARLQALAVQQLLASQTEPLANQAPQALLSLFRS